MQKIPKYKNNCSTECKRLNFINGDVFKDQLPKPMNFNGKKRNLNYKIEVNHLVSRESLKVSNNNKLLRL